MAKLCAKILASGKRCRREAPPGANFCAWHSPFGSGGGGKRAHKMVAKKAAAKKAAAKKAAKKAW